MTLTNSPPRGSRDLTLQTKCRRSYSAPMAVRQGVKNSKTGATGLVELKGQVIGFGTSYQVFDGFGSSGSFTETIHYGACRDALASPSLDVAFLVGHDNSRVPLARTNATAALTLTETRAGLQVKALVDPRMNAAQELIYGLELGVIGQMSVGMRVDSDVWSGSDASGMPNKRDIYKLDLFDVSAVSFPANPDTALELASAALRALRNAPTAADPGINQAIVHAHAATAAALAAQSQDSDNNSDPADKSILAALKAAHASLTVALGHQALDGTPDADGTSGGGGGDAPGIGNQDGTGSRNVARMIEDDTRRLRDLRIDTVRARIGAPKPKARAKPKTPLQLQIDEDKLRLASWRTR